MAADKKPKSQKPQKENNYTKEDLDKAIELVKSGKTAYASAKSFGVPVSTIRARVLGVNQEKPGRPTVFSEHEERTMSRAITFLAECGFGLSSGRALMLAQNYANQLQKQTPWQDNKPGIDWLRLFRERHNISLRHASN